ncbi:hypothetical protein [Paenibacillus polymyxa]|uniref:hypothetical protein n=1 Tax=Paenibacillus polymyxa TaxID=1406 RepID=UPI0003FB381E|nr:hypothetical protein [Paenibacillus polymyxa]
MRDKKFLLTFQNSENASTFAWFETEAEMNDFIESENINVIEALFVEKAQTLL